MRRARGLGVEISAVTIAKVYLIEAPLDDDSLASVQRKLLTDPVVERAVVGVAQPLGDQVCVEVHPLPGVMDPVAQSVQEAIRTLTGLDAAVSTGVRYDLGGLSVAAARTLASRALANPAIHQITDGPWTPDALPRGRHYDLNLRSVRIRGLSDDELTRMSREAHLFLSLEEMRRVKAEYERIGREPTDIELETIAQTWSEHCVHKTLKSSVNYRTKGEETIDWSGRPGTTVGPDGKVAIKNLLKSTVAAATFELIEEGCDWALSVFKDNSGVVALDDEWAVNIKVETHNRPSAIEPYGGAATGAGGCIRDVLGTGLGAKPIANTDVFCVAEPARWGRDGAALLDLPPGTLHPTRILTDVVAGVRDYGNRMGIPTVSGAVYFDDRYVGNPLVFCGCIGLIPRGLIKGAAKKGDRIIALGGRTGRDGIHGATFSSAELESTASTEFAHAVQIGNAIEEKRVLDAIMRARDEAGKPLYSGMTDCGAGGFSSAVGEMGGEIGATVDLDKAPLKYDGLSYTEIWISEAQERMVLAVPAANLPRLKEICDQEGVEVADLGVFGTDNKELVLRFRGTEVGRLSMDFLHDGIPMPVREAVWDPAAVARIEAPREKKTGPALLGSMSESLLAILAHPNIASKHWIIRQYDHEVQGNTVLKPLVGPGGNGPGDASILEPVAGSGRGVAISCGLQTAIGDPAIGGDPYQMTLAAIDECVRNLVCVGADPSRIAILDNFCWPSCDREQNMAALVRAAAACYDGAKAYGTPFVSGKDSLNNQLRYKDPATGEQRLIEIPYTLLITGLGLVPKLARTTTMDAKTPGSTLLLVGETTAAMAGSHFARLLERRGEKAGDLEGIPTVDLAVGPATARAVSQLIRDGLVISAHDCSDGGSLAAVAEMLIATTGPASNDVSLRALLQRRVRPLGFEWTADIDTMDQWRLAFAETPCRYVLEVDTAKLEAVRQVLRDHGRPDAAIRSMPLGRVTDTGRLVWKSADMDLAVDDLLAAWREPLDW